MLPLYIGKQVASYIQFNSRGMQYNELIICDYSGKGQYNPEIFDAILLNTSNK